MKVYVVTSGEYSDYGITAIFSTEEKASQFLADNRDPESGRLSDDLNDGIDTWEVDVPYQRPVWATQYTVRIRLSDGGLLAEHSYRMVAEANKRGTWYVFTGSKESQGTSFISKDHALKLAAEGRQAYLRSGLTSPPGED